MQAARSTQKYRITSVDATIRRLCACIAMCGLCLLATAEIGWAADGPTFLLRWGTRGAALGQFGAVYGIGIDPQGQIYVADAGLNRIQVFSADSLLLRTIGTVGSGPGQFRSVRDVAVDHSGNVYALDSESATPDLGRIEVFDASGDFVRQWPLAVSRLSHSIALSPDDSLVYATVGEYVLKYTTTGLPIAQWSYLGTNNGNFGNRGVAVGASGAVYVASINLGIVVKYSPNGDVLNVVDQIDTPLGVALDSGERLYVSTGIGEMRCQMRDASGLYLAGWGAPGTENGQFTYPLDLAVAPNGDVFVIDEARPWIQKFGFVATAAVRGSWGELKSRFR